MIIILLLAGVFGWVLLAVYHTGVSASVRRAVVSAPSGHLLYAPPPVQGPGLRESLAPLLSPTCYPLVSPLAPPAFTPCRFRGGVRV